MEQIDENSFLPKTPKESITDILEKGVFLTMEDDLQKAESGQYHLRKLEPEKIEEIKRIARERSKLGAEFRKKQLQEIFEKEKQTTIEEFQREEREKEVETEEIRGEKEEIKKEKEISSFPPKIGQTPLITEKERPVAEKLPEKLERKEISLEQELKEKELIEQIRRKAQQRAEIERQEQERKKREEQEIVERIRQEAKRRSEIKHQEEKERKKREKEQIREQRIKEIEKLKKEEEREKEEENNLEKEKAEIQQKLRVFPQKIELILEKKSEVKTQKQGLVSKLNQILQKESELERTKESLEFQEERASLQEKHKIEKKRWEVEERLEGIEKEKWNLRDELELKEQEIEKLNKELKDLTSKKEQLEQKLQEINDKLAIIKIKKEKREILGEKLPQLRREKMRSEGRLIDNWKEFQKRKQELEGIKGKEAQIEAQEKEINEREKVTKEFSAKRKLEKQRWQVSRKRKEVEKERWQKEKKYSVIRKSLERSYQKYKVLLEEERALQTKIWKINTILEHGLREGERLIAEKEKQGPIPLSQTEQEPIEPVEKERQQIIQEIRSYFEVQTERAKQQEAVPSISPEGLKEKVIVSQIREAARKRELEEREKKSKEEEREKIIEEKTEKEIKEEPEKPLSKEQLFERLITPSPKEQELRKEFLERVAIEKTKNLAVASLSEKEAGEKPIVFQPVVVVKKASLPQKLLVRILFILLGVGLIAGIVFGLKGFVFKKRSEVQPPSSQLPPASLSTTTEQALPTTTEKIISPTSSVPTTTVPTTTVSTTIPIPTVTTSTSPVPSLLPASRATSTSATSSQERLLERKETPPETLFPVAKNREIRLSSFTDFASLLERLEKERPADSQFQQLLVQDASGHYLNLKEFLDIFGTEIKEDFWQLTGTSTIFIYYSKEGFSGLGFVSYVSDRQKLQSFMKEWEQSIAQDLDNFLFVVAGQDLKYRSYFKTAHYQDIPFRYLDAVNKYNFGICYTFWRNYFVFTTSGETMIALLKDFNQQ